jgi:hypothetical protein
MIYEWLIENGYWMLGSWAIFYFFIIPLLVKFAQVYPRRPEFVQLDWNNLRQSHADFLVSQSQELFELGFEQPTLLECTNNAPNVVSYWIHVVNQKTLEEGIVCIIIGEEGMVRLTAKVVEFCSTFDSQIEINTTNTKEILPFPPAPNTIRTQVPAAHTVTQLYRVHRHLIEQHCATAKAIRQYPHETVIERLQRDFAETYERQVPRGVLFYTESDDAYRPTYVGVYRLCWMLMPPLKWWHQFTMRLRGRRILAEVERRS